MIRARRCAQHLRGSGGAVQAVRVRCPGQPAGPGARVAPPSAMTRRSLLPREHGAYFQLGIPLIIAYLRCAANLAMVELTAAAALAFLANEPLLVVLGHRGRRRYDQHG